MLAKGLNPYVEFRRRDFDKADKHLEKTLKEAVTQNKINLSEALLKEEEEYRRKEAAESKERVTRKTLPISSVFCFFLSSVPVLASTGL